MKNLFYLAILLFIVFCLVLLSPFFWHIDTFGNDEKYKTTETQVAYIFNALDSYRLDVGAYPLKIEHLVTNSSKVKNWDGPYLQKIPVNDSWGNPFLYKKINTGFLVCSYGSDGKAGGFGEQSDIDRCDI